jgi:hypothetical protein
MSEDREDTGEKGDVTTVELYSLRHEPPHDCLRDSQSSGFHASSGVLAKFVGLSVIHKPELANPDERNRTSRSNGDLHQPAPRRSIGG